MSSAVRPANHERHRRERRDGRSPRRAPRPPRARGGGPRRARSRGRRACAGCSGTSRSGRRTGGAPSTYSTPRSRAPCASADQHGRGEHPPLVEPVPVRGGGLDTAREHEPFTFDPAVGEGRRAQVRRPRAGRIRSQRDELVAVEADDDPRDGSRGDERPRTLDRGAQRERRRYRAGLDVGRSTPEPVEQPHRHERLDDRRRRDVAPGLLAHHREVDERRGPWRPTPSTGLPPPRGAPTAPGRTRSPRRRARAPPTPPWRRAPQTTPAARAARRKGRGSRQTTRHRVTCSQVSTRLRDGEATVGAEDLTRHEARRVRREPYPSRQNKTHFT